MKGHCPESEAVVVRIDIKTNSELEPVANQSRQKGVGANLNQVHVLYLIVAAEVNGFA